VSFFDHTRIDPLKNLHDREKTEDTFLGRSVR